MQQVNVGIIGTGYVGAVTGACLASVGHIVTCYDSDDKKVARWNSNDVPLSEPSLDETIFAHRGKNLFFTSDGKTAVSNADIVFVCVNTPTKISGVHKGCFETSYIEQSAVMIAKYLKSGAVVAGKSTVSVGNAECLEDKLRACVPKGIVFSVASNPEFLAEGTAIKDFLEPDRVLIGIKAGDVRAKQVFDDVYFFVPAEKRIFSDCWSSELAKLANNAALVSRLTLINSLNGVCEDTGADTVEVAKIIGFDHRIGSRYLKPGIGFGGSCFSKDVRALVYLLKKFNRTTEAHFYEAALKLNYELRDRFVRKMYDCLYSLKDKRIALLGFAFKPDTDDVRDAPAITIAKRLLDEGAFVRVCDPKAGKYCVKCLESSVKKVGVDKLSVYDDPYKAVEGCAAIALITEWQIFRELDFSRIKGLVENSAWVFDGRNVYDSKKVNGAGLNYYGVGRGIYRKCGK